MTSENTETITLADATATIRGKVANSSPVAAVITFDFAENGVITINGADEPPVVTNEKGDADCTIHVSLASFASFLDGSDNPQMAFMTGRLRVEGDMGIALQLSSIVGQGVP